MELKKKLDKVIEWVLAGLFLLMTLVVIWQVFARYLSQLFTVSSSFTEELSKYLLIWVALIGSAYVTGKNKHLAVDILLNKLDGHKKKYLQLFIHSIILLFALVVLVIGGISLVSFNAELGQQSSSLGIPVAIVYSVVPVSGILILIYTAFDLIAIFKK